MGTYSRRPRCRRTRGGPRSGSHPVSSGPGGSTRLVGGRCGPGGGWRRPPTRAASGPSAAGSTITALSLLVTEGVEDYVAAILLRLALFDHTGFVLRLGGAFVGVVVAGTIQLRPP